MGAVGNTDVLGFHIKLEAVITTIAANTAALNAPKEMVITIILRVHPYHTSVQLLRHTNRTTRIIRPDINRLNRRECRSI